MATSPEVDPAAVTVEVGMGKEGVDEGAAVVDTRARAIELFSTLTQKAADKATVTQLCDLAKEEGPSAMAAFGLFTLLEAEATNTKVVVAREGAMLLMAGLCQSLGRLVEPYLAPLAAVPLRLLADRQKKVSAAAREAVAALKALLRPTPSAAISVVPSLMECLTGATKWQTKVGALTWVVELTEAAPLQLATHLTEMVPVLTELLHDLNSKISRAARDAALAALNLVDNRDVAPFMTDLVDAMESPALVGETIHKLAGLVFVQSVETPTLAVVVPLLHRGLKGRDISVRRCCAVITSNMSKLVDNPSDAAPFLPQILPAMERAAEETSDPEARGVAEKARDQLLRIKEAAELRATHPVANTETVLKMLKEAVVAKLDAPMPVPAETSVAGAGAEIVGSDLAIEAMVPAVSDRKAGVTREAALAAREAELSYVATMCASLVSVRVYETTAWNASIVPYLTSMAILPAADAMAVAAEVRTKCSDMETFTEEDEEDDDLEELCNCDFTLAYGTKILLHNTKLRLKRGARYALLGGNNSGKSTLLKAIAEGAVEGFPTDVRTVAVESDIQGEMSHLSCLDYVFSDPVIRDCDVPREEVQRMLMSVGFSEKMCGDATSTLSGGWRVKLALSRAMLQNADVLLLDEPANHLDVINVRWVEDYLVSLKDVTSIIVSHHAALLDKCCTHCLEIEDLKLKLHHGNLSAFRDKFPAKARSYFELVSESLKFEFHFPTPGPLEGVTSKGRVLMKIDNAAYQYPINPKPTIEDITVRVSLSSRVACVGRNGAGKSTLIKVLTGELTPQTGKVWVHPSARIAYIPQHAFASIEHHLEKTPAQYIMWRFATGEDKEALRKEAIVLTEEEKAKIAQPLVQMVDGKKTKRVIKELVDRRKARKGTEHEYQCTFVDMPRDVSEWMDGGKLRRLGFEKLMKACDSRVLAREAMYRQPLTSSNVEKHCQQVGLEPEVTSHSRIGALSGGERVKVVLAACTWFQPHILILDEPTNYLDRDSLAALAGAIREFEGGVLMITHNDAFCSALCPETWVLERADDGIGHLTTKGDAEWMKNALKEKVEFKAMDTMIDAAGNEVKVKKGKKKLSRKEIKARKRAAKAAGREYFSDEDDMEDWEAGAGAY